MSSNLFKIGHVLCQDNGLRMIDSNERVARRIEQLTETLENSTEEEKAELAEGFTEGLMLQQVQQLLSDPELPQIEGEDELLEETPLSNVIKQKAGLKAEKILNGAREEAEEILSRAREEAEQILASAKAEAVNTKAEAQNTGMKQGYDTGYAKGMGEADAMKQDLQEKEEQLDIAYEEQMNSLEPMFIETLAGIYEHIFHVDFENNKDVICHLIQDTIRKIENTKDFIVHVSKDDFGYVSIQKNNLIAMSGNVNHIEIIEDITLAKGQCYIETGGGIFDCGIDTQLENLGKELKLLSYESKTE